MAVHEKQPNSKALIESRFVQAMIVAIIAWKWVGLGVVSFLGGKVDTFSIEVDAGLLELHQRMKGAGVGTSNSSANRMLQPVSGAGHPRGDLRQTPARAEVRASCHSILGQERSPEYGEIEKVPSGSWVRAPEALIRPEWTSAVGTSYECLPLTCPHCAAAPARLIAFITAPATINSILSHLELPATPPPLAPARGPPVYEAELYQTPAWDPAGPQPQPEFEFDQTLSW